LASYFRAPQLLGVAQPDYIGHGYTPKLRCIETMKTKKCRFSFPFQGKSAGLKKRPKKFASLRSANTTRLQNCQTHLFFKNSTNSLIKKRDFTFFRVFLKKKHDIFFFFIR
jgi:hypothetical protein